MFYWTEKKLRLYKRAEEYTGFNKDLSKIVLKHIGRDREIWDIGCGLSYLSLYLSPYSKKIDCIDKSSDALEGLEELVDSFGYKNINLHKADYRDFFQKNSRGDCIVLSHFLRIDENIDYLAGNFETLVIIRNSETRKGKPIFRGRKETIEDVESFLRLYDNSLNYKKIIHRGDFGQPLRSLDEGREYYSSYSGEEISEEEIKKLLKVSDSEDYPYYYPKEKSTGIIIIDRR